MKSLICTDTHLGLAGDSELWIDIVVDFFKHAVKYCIENNINQIIHAGDFFHNRKSLNTKTQHAAHRIAKILKLHKKLHTYIIVGNHDCYYKNQIRPNTLELFKKYDNISVVDSITKLDDILLVPWGEVPTETQGMKYCFGHFAIKGFHMNDSYTCKNGIDAITFKDFEMVASGHFHSPSENGNIIYLGSPYGQTFHDAGGVRGFHTFEDGKLDFFEYKNAPKFKNIHTEKLFGREDVEGNIVKIVFDKNYGTNENQEVIDNILKFKPLLYYVDFANIKMEDSEDVNEENITIDSKQEMASLYIDKQDFPENININTLKSMFKKIMEESGEKDLKVKSSEGTKIECMEIGFKNFLSFGSQWQTIKFDKGVNFITGYNEDTGRSNGAGKSTLLEVIPFALFGKTAREIKQNQIVNWKNKKNCQVKMKFKIDDDLYEIDRQLKPNKLDIYKNGDLIDKDAHKTDYQNMFEDIFGMDLKMFMNVVYSNINNSSNVLSMKKTDKRKFLEKMFGLEVFSDMNSTCNGKLRDIEQKKYKIETDNRATDNQIESLNETKDKLKLQIEEKRNSVKDLNKLKKELDDFKKKHEKEEENLELYEKERGEKESGLKKEEIEHEKNITSKDFEISQIDKELKEIEGQEEQRKKNNKLKKEVDKLEEEFGNTEKINENIEEKENEHNKNKELWDKIAESKVKLHGEIVEIETNIKNVEESLKLLSEGKCPTCGQDATDCVGNHKKDMSSMKRKLTIRDKKMKKIVADEKKYKDEVLECTVKLKVLREAKDKILGKKNLIKEVKSLDKKDELLKEKKTIEKGKKELISKFKGAVDNSNKEIAELKEKIDKIRAVMDEISEKERGYDIAVLESKQVEKHIESLNGMIKEQEVKVKEFTNSITEANKQKKKLNVLTDYINCTKTVLKDENIKQFAIKRIMPFINKQANVYLSEVNYGFYINIDKWLDIEIKGPGIRNATYNSLSSGERKGVDLAVQLSLLDVAQVLSGLFPDILILDELLDSSIDGVGMEQVMRIVKAKQKELDNKVFIISHRSEIDQELVDKNYHVLKSNGFSKINM